jgi:TonB family protein
MSRYRSRWLIVVLLLGCYRHDTAMLREAQLQRAQRSSVDCGDAQPNEPTQPFHDCTVAAFQSRQPFHARFWRQGIDSHLASGVALDATGKLFLYRFDNSPCGAPGRCRASLQISQCAQPYIRESASGKQLACGEPSFNPPPATSSADPPSVEITRNVRSTETPMRVGGDVTAPRVIHRVEPRYEKCKDITLSGVPVLEAVIDVDGRVRDVHLIRAVHPCIDQSVVEAVKQWRFEAGTLNGRPVPTIFNMTMYIHFK